MVAPLSFVVQFSPQMHDNYAFSSIKVFPKQTLAYFVIAVITVLSVDLLQNFISRTFSIQPCPSRGSSDVTPLRIASTTLLVQEHSLPAEGHAEGRIDLPHSLLECRGKFYQPDNRANSGLWKIYHSQHFTIVDTGYLEGFAVAVEDLRVFSFEEGGSVYLPNGTKYEGPLPTYKSSPEMMCPKPRKVCSDLVDSILQAKEQEK